MNGRRIDWIHLIWLAVHIGCAAVLIYILVKGF